jgi:hypothetical protein
MSNRHRHAARDIQSLWQVELTRSARRHVPQKRRKRRLVEGTAPEAVVRNLREWHEIPRVYGAAHLGAL